VAALDAVASWDVAHAAAAVVAADGTLLDTFGDLDRRFELASITKVLSGWTAMVAVEEASVGLDQPAGQPGCTLRHLLAHAGGYPFDGAAPVAAPGRRRIYSNTGIELAAATIAEATGIAFADYLAEAVLEPLAMTSTTLDGSPARGATSTAGDLAKLLAELQQPRLIGAASATAATTVQYPALAGIVPGVGRFDPCPWGLGIEIRGGKEPHWTGTTNSPRTFGHFGGAGTMMWVDPAVGCGLVALTDRPFDSWPEARTTWSALGDAVVADHRGTGD
jgi:CubicO group peptidase (beta-lactamase class C family)